MVAIHPMGPGWLWYCCFCRLMLNSVEINPTCLDCSHERCGACSLTHPEHGDWMMEDSERGTARPLVPYNPTTKPRPKLHYHCEERELPFRRGAFIAGGGNAIVEEIEMTEGEHKGKLFAKKTIFIPIHRASPGSVSEILKESRIAMRLQHPHIIPILFTYECLTKTKKEIGIVMSIIAEMDLSQYFSMKARDLQHGATIDYCRSDLLRWTGCLVRSLAFIHTNRVRHKDLKPSNILIKDGAVVITDFGTAKIFAEGVTTQTFSDPLPRGTPKYYAPEVASEWPDRLPRTRASDIWSMGCVLFEISTFMESGTLASLSDIQRYCDTPDVMLQKILSNHYGENTNLNFLCLLMLNPDAQYRLRAEQLALVLQDIQLPTCTHQLCVTASSQPTWAFRGAIDRLREKMALNNQSWSNITAAIQGDPVLTSLFETTSDKSS